MTQEKAKKLLRSEMLTVVTLKIIAFRDVTSCGSLDVYRCYRGTYCLHRQGSDLGSMFLWNV